MTIRPLEKIVDLPLSIMTDNQRANFFDEIIFTDMLGVELPSPPPPTSHQHQFYGVMKVFTRLFMNPKYICHGLISRHVNLHNNRLAGTINLHVKIFRRGKKEKEPGDGTTMSHKKTLKQFFVK